MMERLMVNWLFMGFFWYSVSFTFKSFPPVFLSILIYKVDDRNRYRMATHEHDTGVIINTLRVRMDLEAPTTCRARIWCTGALQP